MIYCISDIHGDWKRWSEMLALIGFSGADMLYVLGDAIDRRPQGVEILRDIMARPNVRMILGNHEQMMLDSFRSDRLEEARRLWKYNGGSRTYQAMQYKISREERLRILRFVQKLPEYLDIEVNGRKFHLVHGYVGDNRRDRIWGRPEPLPTEAPLPSRTVIAGHTPTCFLGPGMEGGPMEIFHGPGFIDLDCGCGHADHRCRLACLRLDDMREFYVP